jgi:hypothetical protein
MLTSLSNEADNLSLREISYVAGAIVINARLCEPTRASSTSTGKSTGTLL